MAKYRPVAVLDIVKYERGLEDGYICHSIGTSIETGKYYVKGSMMPRNLQQPAIECFDGPRPIYDGDYIVTDKYNRRWICDTDTFNKSYELVEE